MLIKQFKQKYKDIKIVQDESAIKIFDGDGVIKIFKNIDDKNCLLVNRTYVFEQEFLEDCLKLFENNDNFETRWEFDNQEMYFDDYNKNRYEVTFLDHFNWDPIITFYIKDVSNLEAAIYNFHYETKRKITFIEFRKYLKI